MHTTSHSRDQCRRHSMRRFALAVAAAVAVAATFATVRAEADGTYAYWDCSGTPYDPCWSPAGRHTWGDAWAINDANSYRKCERIRQWNSDYNYSRNCYSAYRVYGRITDSGAYLGYPNEGGPLVVVAVGNDTGVHHGLRGKGAY